MEQDTPPLAEKDDEEWYTGEIPKSTPRRPDPVALPTATFIDEPLAVVDGSPVYRFLDLRRLVTGLELSLKSKGFLPLRPETVESQVSAQTQGSQFDGRTSAHPELRFAGEYSTICAPEVLRNKETRRHVLKHVAKSAIYQLTNICFGSLS